MSWMHQQSMDKTTRHWQIGWVGFKTNDQMKTSQEWTMFLRGSDELGSSKAWSNHGLGIRYEGDPDEMPWVEREWELGDHKHWAREKGYGRQGSSKSIQHVKDKAKDELGFRAIQLKSQALGPNPPWFGFQWGVLFNQGL